MESALRVTNKYFVVHNKIKAIAKINLKLINFNKTLTAQLTQITAGNEAKNIHLRSFFAPSHHFWRENQRHVIYASHDIIVSRASRLVDLP